MTEGSAPVALVADDDIELREAMTGILEANGFIVLPASNGDETLKAALSSHVDIILMDQNMPKRSGGEVHQALREAGFAQPIIIVSGYFTETNGVSTSQLRKPFSADELLAAVRGVLAEKTSRSLKGLCKSDTDDRLTDARDNRPLVLIVEDNPSIHRELTECFEPDCRIASAFDSLQGLKLATQLLPDLILTDERLAPRSGEEMIRQIRANNALAKTPILVLAEDASQTTRLLEDVQDFVRKPVSLAEVQARATRLLAAKHTRDAELEGRVKSGFLRMLAHELKTPITAMHLQMRLLERELDSHSSLRDGMDRIAQSSNRLLQLIDTCIEWARVESKRFQAKIDAFDLGVLLTEVIAEFGNHIRRKGIGVDFVPPSELPLLSSDRKLVRLAFLNLINYAIQNTPKGTIKVSVDSDGGCHRVWVTDGGPMIVEPKQVFSPFESAMTGRAGSGSGLGLYVVRDLARAIHGDVVLHNATRAGNTFVLTI